MDTVARPLCPAEVVPRTSPPCHGGAGLGSNYAVRFLDSDRIVIIWNNMAKAPKRMEIFEYLAGRR